MLARLTDARLTRLALLAIGLVVLSRVIVVIASPLDLHGDEAQYFAWSRDLAAGYFSKPPLIGWTIRASTALFGTQEWGVRLWSPLVHGLTALLVWRAGRTLLGARAGAWAGVIYLTLPGVWLSSLIASTDALVLCATAGMMAAWARLRADGPRWRWTVALGLAVGLGALAKYAIVFPVIGLGLVWLTDRPTRSALPLPRLAAAAGLAALMLLPNLLWNLRHDFATARHTAANANLQAELLNPLEGLEFAASQFGVWGPVVFALFLLGLARVRRDATARALVMVALVPLLIILVQAVVSRANANWAATAVVPGVMAVCALWPRHWLGVALGTNAAMALMGTAAVLSPALADALGAANSFKRVRGWAATVERLDALARETGAATVAVDNRITFYALDYYGLDEAHPMFAWQMEATPQHHAELTRLLLEGAPEPILFVNYHDEHRARVEADFATVRELPPLRQPLGGGKVRELDLLLVSGYRRATRGSP